MMRMRVLISSRRPRGLMTKEKVMETSSFSDLKEVTLESSPARSPGTAPPLDAKGICHQRGKRTIASKALLFIFFLKSSFTGKTCLRLLFTFYVFHILLGVSRLS